MNWDSINKDPCDRRVLVFTAVLPSVSSAWGPETHGECPYASWPGPLVRPQRRQRWGPGCLAAAASTHVCSVTAENMHT